MAANKFTLKFWQGKWYCMVVMPDGNHVEIASDTDLTFTQWQAKVQQVWQDSQNPPPQPGQCTCLKCGKSFLCPNRTV
jgi:hypothetical protein